MRYDLGAALAGVIFTVLGAVFLLDAIDAADFRFELVLPIGAIAIGVAAILSALLRSEEPS